MITKFILFENQELGQRYWKILIDDYFFVRLEKIGVSEQTQNEIYEHYCDLTDNVNGEKFRFVYVGEDNYGGKMSDWHWNFDQKQTVHRSIFCAESPGYNYVYQGEIEVTQEDIDDWKIKKDAKKYNL